MGNKLLCAVVLFVAFCLSAAAMASLSSVAKGYTVPGYAPYAYPPFPDSIQASIISPNGSYAVRDIPLIVNISVTYNTPAYPQQQAYKLTVELITCRFSIDGHEWENIPLINKTSERSFGDPIWQQEITVAYCVFETSLKDESIGHHQLRVNAYDSVYGPSDSRVTQGNAKSNFTIVDNTPPTIDVLTLKNNANNPNETWLSFAIGEPVFNMTYSIDGTLCVSIPVENKSLFGLPVGNHSIVFYAEDLSGNIGVSKAFGLSVPDIGSCVSPTQTSSSSSIVLPGSTSTPKTPPSFLGTSLPSVYGYAIVTAAVVAAAVAAMIAVRKHSRSKAEP